MKPEDILWNNLSYISLLVSKRSTLQKILKSCFAMYVLLKLLDTILIIKIPNLIQE